MRLLTSRIKNLFFVSRYSYTILIVLFILYILLRSFFLFKENFLISFLSDLILIPLVYSLVKYLLKFQEKKNFSQIQILFGFIIFEILFILISETSLYILSPILKDLKNIIIKPTIFIGLISGAYTILYLIFVSIILAIITILFFTKRRKNIDRNYRITIIFFILSALSSNLEKYYNLDFIKYTLITLTVIFFIWMSYQNKWVIYLNKQDKLKVIGLCIALLFIVIFSLIISEKDNQINDLIVIFSNATVTAYNMIFAMALVYSIILLILTIFQLPATEVLEKKTSEIESLQNLSQMISKVLDIDELITFIIQTIEKITGSRDVYICLMDSKNDCNFYTADQNSKDLIDILKNKVFSLIQSQVTKRSLEIDVTEFFTEFNPKIDKLISIPLVYNQDTLGYILIGKDKNSILDEDDLNTLKSIGEYSVVAIQNYRLLQKSIEKERLERELEVAREVQKKLIPERTPLIESLDVSFAFIPAFEVGGDYIDYFKLDEDNFGFIVADVSGKGISAAFYMAEVKGIFESLSKILINPKDILIQANKILSKSLDKKSFVSAVYATINSKTGLVKIARAGHCPILYLSNSILIELKPSGIAIGLDVGNLFENYLEEISFQLKKNDLILFYTDGVTEARNNRLEEFGTEQLNLIVSQSVNETSYMVIQKIIEKLTIFSKDYPQHDDITLLAIKYLGDKNERI